MIDEKKRKWYEADIEKFMPMLGTVSDKYLEKLIKISQGTPKITEHIASMLIVNDHLHDWTITDLLDRHKRLVTIFKKTKQFSNAPKDLKKFLNNDYAKVMPLIKIIATDLERLGFKNFWLEEKLPLLKERISDYQVILSEFDIAGHVNNWAVNKKILDSGKWYVLAYSGANYNTLLKEYRVISSIISSERLFERMISYGLKMNIYQKSCKVLKPTPELKAEFKGHKRYKSFKGIASYAEGSLKLALKIYLLEGCGNMAPDLPEDYPFAAEILTYLREHDKPDNVPVGDYVGEMMKKFSK